MREEYVGKILQQIIDGIAVAFRQQGYLIEAVNLLDALPQGDFHFGGIGFSVIGDGGMQLELPDHLFPFIKGTLGWG